MLDSKLPCSIYCKLGSSMYVTQEIHGPGVFCIGLLTLHMKAPMTQFKHDASYMDPQMGQDVFLNTFSIAYNLSLGCNCWQGYSRWFLKMILYTGY